MKNVELVRKMVVGDLRKALMHTRAWLTMTGDNTVEADKLRDLKGDTLLADLTEKTMSHLGHDTQVTTETEVVGQTTGRRSRARKAAAGAM